MMCCVDPSPPTRADPFPREPFLELVRRLPAYGRLAWRVAREPELSRGRRAVLLAGAAYLLSPIDLVPGIIPVAGQLDDAAAVLLALRAALAGLPTATQDRHLADTGLSRELLDADLQTIGATGAWMARGAGRLAWRGARATGRLGARLARSGLSSLRRRGR